MVDPPPTPHWRRLHPATVFIEVIHRAVSLAWFFAIVIYLLLRGGKPDPVEYVIAAFAVIQLLAPIHTYLTLRYAVTAESLLIRSGVVFRRLRSIPLERVQHINLKRGVLHRVFHVVALSVETAGGGQAEAQLSAISEAEAARLRLDLLRLNADPNPEPRTLNPASSELIWSATWKDLLILGATENRIALLIGGLAALMQTAEELLDTPALGKLFELRDIGDALTLADGLFVAGGVVFTLFVVGSLLSITLTFVTHYGFTLRRIDEKLARHYGLFTQHENLLPAGRVQVVKVERPLLRRLMGYATVHVETAGSVTAEERRLGTAPLCPLIEEPAVAALVRLVFPTLDLNATPWNRVSPVAIRRAAIRYTLLQSIALAALGYWFGWGVLLALPGVLLIAHGSAVARYRAMGYAEVGPYILVRSGVLNRRTWIVPCSKVQSLVVGQSPFQRRYDLSSLTLRTAGSGPLAHPRVPDLPRPLALEIQDRLSTATHQAGEWVLDGV